MRPAASSASQTLPRQERLANSRQFLQVYTQGKKFSTPHLTLYVGANQLNLNRLGLVVSKKRFKLSVQRHCLQRRLREIYRRNKHRFIPGYDLVFSAQNFALEQVRFLELQKELLLLMQKANLQQTEVSDA